MVFGEIHSTDNNIFEVPDDIQEKFNKDVERLNDLATSFGKENFEKWLEKRISDIVYYNKEKTLNKILSSDTAIL